MPDTFAQLDAERTRLHGKSLEAIIDMVVGADEGSLRVKDSRIPGENQALSVNGYTPGSWHPYTVAQSQTTFT